MSFEDVLTHAGICPLVEVDNPLSPCIPLLRKGLEVHQTAEGPRQWVTAVGWGNPDADIYILGSTPKWHEPTIEGLNYASAGTDRKSYALRFAHEFPAWIARTGNPKRTTTKWTEGIIRALRGDSASLQADAFVLELMLCPQPGDPPINRFIAAYRKCAEFHALALIGKRSIPPTVLILGGGVTRILYTITQSTGPVPSYQRPIVFRPKGDGLRFDLVASLAPRAAMVGAGLNQQAWIERMVETLHANPTRTARLSDSSATSDLPKQRMQVGSKGWEQLSFHDEGALGLTKRSGRRWSVTQSLTYGGTVEEILARAEAFNRRRSRDAGRPPATGISLEGRHLRDTTSDYPARLISAGWDVRLAGGRWVASPPGMEHRNQKHTPNLQDYPQDDDRHE